MSRGDEIWKVAEKIRKCLRLAARSAEDGERAAAHARGRGRGLTKSGDAGRQNGKEAK